MKKLLMVCYGGGHVRIIAPLYEAYKDRYDVQILALTTAGYYLDEYGIPFIRMSDFESIITNKVIKYGLSLIDINADQSVVPLKESIAYHGLSFLDLIAATGSESKARERFKKEGRACFLPIETLSKIIKIIEPNVVIATNSPRAERAALIAAKQLSIPSLCINDNVWIEGGARKIAELGCVDVLCVLSQEVKNKILDKTNFDEDKIVVTGTPVFDELNKLKSLKKNYSCQKVILLADSDLPHTSPLYPGISADPTLAERVRCELDVLAVKNCWKMIFRPHPSQNYNYSKYKNISISEKSEALNDLLLTVDIVVTAISTVGLEGKVIGKGLVSIEGSVYRAGGSYAELGLSTGIINVDQLESAIKKELSLSTASLCKLYEGCSKVNIANCIDNLI